ncbi:hypothetical protein [Candidatus Spongiihabitans sp.]|uniref:hypothetical protein n=1 Tax=Candidatus Spongiihabitans sp. TaxID=3101308 RepID=UPI003C7E496F
MTDSKDNQAKNHREMESLNKRLRLGRAQLRMQYAPLEVVVKNAAESFRPAIELSKTTQSSLNRFFDMHQEQFDLTQKTIKSMSDKYQEPFDSLRENTKRIEKILQPVIEVTRAVDYSIKLWSDRHQGQFDSIREAVKRIEKSFQPGSEWAKAIEKIERYFVPIACGFILAVENQHRIYEEHFQSTGEASLLLAEHCWSFDLNMSVDMLQELKETTKEDIVGIEYILMEYFEWRLDEIETSLITRFPHRADNIRSAFNAHRCGEYNLSVPAFLMQTDGVCKEMTGKNLFMKENKQPKIANYVAKRVKTKYMAALLGPLTITTPINASEHEREEGSNKLNRHTVMHGESLDYGTKANSLKALSLFNYASQVLEMLDRHHKTSIRIAFKSYRH